MPRRKFFQKENGTMERVYGCCCGVDVHKKLIVACLRKGTSEEQREYGTTTVELLKLADWLAGKGCEMAAMESTASYWKPLYNVLEEQGLGVMVVNARHMKAVPGRKTDAKDAWWIADLLQHIKTLDDDIDANMGKNIGSQ